MTKLPPWIMDSQGRMIYTPSGDAPWEPQLTPGADLAKRQGCTCSRLDNKWGAGRPCEPQIGEEDWVDVEFLVTPGCPLHDNNPVEPLGNRENQRTEDHPSSPDVLANVDAEHHERQGLSLELGG